MFMLTPILRRLIVEGELTITDSGGKVHRFGGSEGPSVAVRFHEPLLPLKIALNPSMALGEAYMDGRLTVDDGNTIYEFLDLLTRNIEKTGQPALQRLFAPIGMLFRRIHQFNPAFRSKRNVAHHYDLSGELYDLFLDQDKQYSCAYFPAGVNDIDTAQERKKRHIAAKLLLEDGQTVLDIGSGWGGMGLYLAESAGSEVTGITLSEEQVKVSKDRAAQAGLQDRAQFHLRDYRDQTGHFDRIVSVGMFEHVGVGHFGQYFGKIHEVLADDGVALLHTIGRSDGPGNTDPWIRKYIFPGGYIPSLSETMPAIERAGLIVTDIEFLGPHYAETLKAWRQRFRENWDKVADLYDENFCRMWEFYLAGSEVSFRFLGLTVFQIQMTKRAGVVPMTRDYIAEWEKTGGSARPASERAA